MRVNGLHETHYQYLACFNHTSFFSIMDDQIATFLAFTGSEDAATAKQYLELSGNNLEYAVQLFLEAGANNQPSSAANADEEYATRLQNEAYEANVREADANVHRHDTLVDSFPSFGQPAPLETDMFGRGRVGIFNQRFEWGEEGARFEDDDDYDFEAEPRVVELNDEDLDEIMELDEDQEPTRPTRRTRLQQSRMSELTSTQRRLAELFKPPFDLIERTNLDGAKVKGRAEKKWILVNIQDQTEFQCQVLNRDFWANKSVKAAVRKDFIFLQFQHDSVNGETYLNFYHVDTYPHIAILDPMTGEKVFSWKDGEVPDVEEWLADVELFLEKFSLQPGSNNPVVKHEVKFDPDAMSEEQQMEFALKQSMAEKGATAEDAINLDSEHEEEKEEETGSSAPEVSLDIFGSIKPIDHPEPTEGPTTRVQLRFPNGKRLIHKFAYESDKVRQLYEWLKFVLLNAEAAEFGISGDERFTISSVGNPKLIECLDMTIGEAGLKNASILLEKE